MKKTFHKMAKLAITSVIGAIAITTLSITAFASPADSDLFKITVEVPSKDEIFTLPATGSFGIDCDGAGTTYDYQDAQAINYTCDYTKYATGNPMQYDIWITPEIENVHFIGGSHADRIISINQWGTAYWKTMYRSYQGCTNLTLEATDIPILSATNDLEYMFDGATNLQNSGTINIGSWDITSIAIMDLMLRGVTLNSTQYDSILEGWASQSITNKITFDGGNSTYCSSDAINARKHLINDLSWTITDGGQSCTSGSGGQGPDDFIITIETNTNNEDFVIPESSGATYSVDCDNDGTYDFTNQTGNVTCNYPTSGQYEVAISNTAQYLPFIEGRTQDKIIDINQWGTSTWKSMNIMFSGSTQLGRSGITATGTPNLSSCTSLESMFNYASSFNQDIGNWDVSNITNMHGMFYNADSFNQNINSWNVSNVTNMAYMFYGNNAFNQPLNTWDTSNVNSMSNMFYNATSFNQPLNNWDTSNVNSMSNMFFSATAFNQDLSNWNITKVNNGAIASTNSILNIFSNKAYAAPTASTMEGIFINSGLSTAMYDLILKAWASQAVQSSVILDLGTIPYCNASAEHATLIAAGWTINDGGQNCPNPEITSNGGGATAGIKVAEEITTVTTVTAINGTPTFSITSGADQSKFAINGTSGVLTFINGHTIDTPEDSNSDNIYVVEVTATYNGKTDTQTLNVEVSDDIEEGRVMGTISNTNTNAGNTHFNSHPSIWAIPAGYEDKYNQPADLSIIGEPDGLAPADATVAVHAVYDNDTGDPNTSSYKLEGYAWNDNLGFINFNQDATNYTHISEIGTPSARLRQLTGYAWNQSFGWIYFNPGGGYAPITLNSSGFVTGYAWTEAGIWINFTNTEIELPGTEPSGNYCDGVYNASEPSVCVEVAPSDGKTEDEVIANGTDKYNFKIYPKNTSGGLIDIDTTNYDIDLTFHWTHTLKTNQEAGQKALTGSNNIAGSQVKIKNDSLLNVDFYKSWALDSSHTNFPPLDITQIQAGNQPQHTSDAGIVKKPVIVYDPMLKLNGDHYEFIDPLLNIKSYAPTTIANTSIAQETGQLIENDMFVTDVKDPDSNPQTSLLEVERNDLILHSIDYKITDTSTGDEYNGTTFVNGKPNYEFKFKPVIEIPTLYADTEKDNIEGFRGIPTIFTYKETKNNTGGLSISPIIKLFLGYDTTKTAENESCNTDNFNFNFIEDSTNPETGETTTTVLDNPQIENPPTFDIVKTLKSMFIYTPDENDQTPPCSKATGPSIFSKIAYEVTAGENDFGKNITVKYYNNKLPKTTTEFINPSISVHGLTYAQATTNVNADSEVILAGKLTTSEIRDTLKKNVLTKLGTTPDTNLTTITSITQSTKTVTNKAGKTEYIYYTNTPELKITGIPDEVKNNANANMTVINDGGSIVIANDIYQTPRKNNAIIAFRGGNKSCEGTAGNVYITSNVKNIQASIAADCSIFSVNETGSNIEDGRPKWANQEEMIQELNKQLVIEGSLFSRNTIGGADLDTIGKKDYILLGTGKVIETKDINSVKDRIKAQQYDLNYLRLFKLQVETDGNGNPIDQICQKALTFNDMITIKQGGIVKGNENLTNPHNTNCDGIDATKPWDPDSTLTGTISLGDLIAIPDSNFRAKGDDNGFEKEFAPSLIKYVQPTSFVFEKVKSLIVK